MARRGEPGIEGDLGDRAISVRELDGCTVNAALAQVFAGRAPVELTERAREVDRVHTDALREHVEPSYASRLLVKQVAYLAQPPRRGTPNAVVELSRGRRDQFEREPFDRE